MRRTSSDQKWRAGRWQLSRCDNSTRVQRVVKRLIAPGSLKFVAPLDAALLVAARRVPPFLSCRHF